MEDSSSNPYIPQESDAIRQKVYEHQSPLGKVVKISLIVTVVVAILVAVGLFFVVPRTSVNDRQARIKLADALQPPNETQKRVSVESNLGFKLNYDNLVYSSYAEVGDSSAGSDNSAALTSGQTYENNELRVMRDYNYVRVRPIESVESARALAPLPPELEIFATVSDDDLTKALTVPENKGLSKLSLFVKMDGDRRSAKKIADDKTVVSIDMSKPVGATIGGINYQKVRYTTTNDNHRISNVKYDDCYYTIQKDQPYSICVSGVRPTSISAASLVEKVFGTLAFTEPVAEQDDEESTDGSGESEKTSLLTPSIRLAQATDSSDSMASDTAADPDQTPLLTIKPPYYTDADSLAAIAKAQPSVVRVATLYCADLALKLESGDTLSTLTNSCVGNLASGVIVSKDGYIATTGHAVRELKKAAIGGYINFSTDRDQMIEHLQRVLDYLLKSKIILQSDADYLLNGAETGDQEALAKIENIGSVIPDNFITPLNEDYQYAIQPTDKPIVVNRTDAAKSSFAYSDTVIKAKYVASDYEASKSVQEVFGSQGPSTDVGLLKAEGDFQDVSIAESVDIKTNDKIDVIGFPSYTDSSLTIDKTRNRPVVTSATVEQSYEKDGGRLIQTNTPILPGNDGAPVFSSKGELIGFAVYGLSYCPDQQCFANGTVRTSEELRKLLDKNNIELNVSSDASAAWNEGVAQYMRGNYSASTNAFRLAASAYPFNVFAADVQKVSSAGEGSDNDTSLMNQLQQIMIIVLAILGTLTVVLGILFVIHKRRISAMRVGHYGADSVSTPVSYPSQAQPQLPPMQQAVGNPTQQHSAMPESPYNSQPSNPYSVQQPTYPAQPQQPPQPLPQNPPTSAQDSQTQSEDPFYRR